MIEHGPQVAHGYWSDWEACQSSIWHELKAVLNVLQSFHTRTEDPHQLLAWYTGFQNMNYGYSTRNIGPWSSIYLLDLRQ